MAFSPKRTCGKRRGSAERSTQVQNLILRLRRAKRVCRPHIVVFMRFFIVLFTIMELKPSEEHFKHELFSFLSRLNVLLGMMSGIFSIIYFDTKGFSIALTTCICIKFLFDIHVTHDRSIAQLLAWVTLHCSAVLFSMFVGRRRSIIKAMPIKARSDRLAEHAKAMMSSARYVDVLEVGIRVQTAILAVDYAMSRRVGVNVFVITLVFAVLFVLGVSTKRNGTILTGLLALFAVVVEQSPVLGFGCSKSVSTVFAAVLGISVGPGGFSVDEWVARSQQLCY